MAQRNKQNAISLFPFLAVLVCTMGALILLLLVTTRRIRNEQVAGPAHDAPGVVAADAGGWGEFDAGGDTAAPLWANLDAAADAQQDDFAMSTEAGNVADDKRSDDEVDKKNISISLLPPTVDPDAERVAVKQAELEDLQELLRQENVRHEFLLKEIEQAKTKLQGTEPDSDKYQVQLHELTTLKRQEEELKAELQDKERLLVDLQTELEQHSEKTEQGEQILRRRESALISLREIAKQKQEAAAAGTDETVIDFTNPTGTRRSPVIVDVTKDGFEFLPSKIKLTPQDMEGFPANDNPLLAGIFAVHETRNPNTLSAQPYVLLLVRPSGSMAFYAAQRTLTDAHIHFGYELVEEDRRISAGTESADETRALRQSVLAALNRRSELYGGMIARIDALREPAEHQNESGRGVSVLPDGRIAADDEFGAGLDNKFYAGGHAKPEAEDVFGKLADAAQKFGATAGATADNWPSNDDGGNDTEDTASTGNSTTDTSTNSGIANAWKTFSPPTAEVQNDEATANDFAAVKAGGQQTPSSADTAAAEKKNPWTFGNNFSDAGQPSSIADPFTAANGFPELVDARKAPAAMPFELPGREDPAKDAPSTAEDISATQDAFIAPPSDSVASSDPNPQSGSAWKGSWTDALKPMEIVPSPKQQQTGPEFTESPFQSLADPEPSVADMSGPGDGKPDNSEPPRIAIDLPKAALMFPRPGEISGNLGAGGSRSMDGPSAEPQIVPDVPAPEPVEDTREIVEQSPPKFRLFGEEETSEATTVVTPSKAFTEPSPWTPIQRKQADPTDVTLSQPTDRTSSPSRSGWPAQSTAPSGTGTRTAATAENSLADASNTSVFGPSGIRTANPEGAASAGGIIGSREPATEVPFLQKFLQSVEAQREPAEPDSFLLSLLEKGKARHGSSGTTANPAATNTEATQPAKPQAAKSTAPAEPAAGTSQPVSPPQYSRHRVEIILEKNQLTIGDFEAVDTTGWEGEQILAMLLEGLNAELEMQAEEGNAGVAPAVEFLVGSGVDSDLKMLMTELSKIDIPTRSVKPLRHSADPPTAKTTPVLAEPKPKVAPQEPAEPMAPSRPVRSGQGLSI